MPIQIRLVAGGYEAQVTPPHGAGEPWATSGAMGRDQLIAALVQQGCHQSDIGDAFYEADPDWLRRAE